MKVLFLQEQPEVLQLLDQPRDVNPGVGGTSYLTSQIAYELHTLIQGGNTALEVYLGCLNSNMQHFHGIPVVELSTTTKSQCWDVIVSTGGYLGRLNSGEIQLQFRRLIAWIHHPFDEDKISKAQALGAEILSIGKAQYLSNRLIAGEHHQINNLFCAKRIRRAANWQPKRELPQASDSPQDSIRIGYMGALIPSKGFHRLAMQWDAIKKGLESLGMRARLEVIGGSNLYHFDQGHPSLPCDQAYGDLLLSILGNEIGETVHFHGTLGAPRYNLMAQCDLAVVNPDGSGEAFPATILEWLSLGVPVVGSLNYGCADAMKFLPSLTIRSPQELPQTIKRFAQQPAQDRQKLHEYCYHIGSSFSCQQPYLIQQWLLLLTKPEQQVNINPVLPPAAVRSLLKNYVEHNINRCKQSLKRWLFKR